MQEFPYSELPYNLMPALRQRAEQILHHGLERMADLTKTCQDPQAPATAWCSGSNLHRGCYHPSPVHDLIVGNLKRGKLCRSDNRQLSHRYWFNSDGQLLRIEYVHQGQPFKTEYLFYEGNVVWGITIGNDGHLAAVACERYDQGRLRHWVLAQCDAAYGEPRCFGYHEEEYRYDDEGIARCHWIDFTPPNGFPQDEVFTFERQDGYLVAYTSGPHGSRYLIKNKRKA